MKIGFWQMPGQGIYCARTLTVDMGALVSKLNSKVVPPCLLSKNICSVNFHPPSMKLQLDSLKCVATLFAILFHSKRMNATLFLLVILFHSKRMNAI